MSKTRKASLILLVSGLVFLAIGLVYYVREDDLTGSFALVAIALIAGAGGLALVSHPMDLE